VGVVETKDEERVDAGSAVSCGKRTCQAVTTASLAYSHGNGCASVLGRTCREAAIVEEKSSIVTS